MIDQFSFWYDTHCDSFVSDNFHSYCLMPDESLKKFETISSNKPCQKAFAFIQNAKCVKYLGLTLDENLSGLEIVSNILKKSSGR